MKSLGLRKTKAFAFAFVLMIASALCALSVQGAAYAQAASGEDSPPDELAVQVFVNGYSGMVVYERDYSAAELESMGVGREPVKFCGYRGGQFPSGRVATVYVPFTELFADANVRFGPGDSLVMGSSSGATKITYEDCFAAPRYYYPHFYDSKNACFTNVAGATEVVPSLLIKSYGIPHPEDLADSSAGVTLDQQLDQAARSGLCDYKYAYMMGFGQRSIGDTEEDTYSAMGWSRQSEVLQVTYSNLDDALEKLSSMYVGDAAGTSGLASLLNALIQAAESDDAQTPVGANVQEVPLGVTFATPSAKAAFADAIAAAKSTSSDSTATGSAMVAACQRLQGVQNAFDAAKLIGVKSCYGNFVDVKAEVDEYGLSNVWYVSDGWLDSVVDARLMAGYADGSGNFGPYDLITRGQVAVIVHRAATGAAPGETDNDVEAGFADVDCGAYYTSAVKWCAEWGIVTGYADGSGEFRPNQPVSRQELATMLARFAGWAKTGLAEAPVADSSCYLGLSGAEDVEPFARASVAWCVENGVISGIGGTDLAPADGAWRASMAKMMTIVLRENA